MIISSYFNQFQTNICFIPPENLWFSDIFRENKKENIGLIAGNTSKI